MILDKFPGAEEFYKTYWGQKPFVVRGAIDQSVFGGLIDGDTLAGLSLEEDIKSRLVIAAPEGGQWECHHGPFDEERFSGLGEQGWSLLVQNVEQYHTDTASLLRSFHFSPRWLMDDIMVSYSAVGGGVGPHTDSYHVFLVQGMGRRKWKLSHDPVVDEELIDNQDLKVLKAGFEGEEVEVAIGDVIYIPPHFAHEGTTLEEAITFSVGFLGPQLSDMLAGYAFYLEEQAQEQNKRYAGQGLDTRSAAFTIDQSAQNAVQNDLVKALQSDGFSLWMAQYFSTPTHEEVENIEPREHPVSSADLLGLLQEGQALYRPEHIKLSMTTSSEGRLNLSVYGEAVPTSSAHENLIRWLNQNRTISMQDIDGLGDQEALMTIITHLYNRAVLFFESKD